MEADNRADAEELERLLEYERDYLGPDYWWDDYEESFQLWPIDRFNEPLDDYWDDEPGLQELEGGASLPPLSPTVHQMARG